MRFPRSLFVVLCIAAICSVKAGYPPAGLELSKGKFLVATRKQGDPRFMQTVVLLVHYSKEGAMGLILNYPTEHSVADAVPEAKRIEGKLFFGGPVERSKIFLLFRLNSSPQDSIRIFDHVYFSSSENALQQAAAGKLRLYSGYSGWASGQLETEIANGHWYVWHADAESIFDKPAEEIWPEMIRRTSVIRASYDHEQDQELATFFLHRRKLFFEKLKAERVGFEHTKTKEIGKTKSKVNPVLRL